jgi:hypothetical protein
LDESFRSFVKFGDNSMVSVMGKGKVTVQTKGNSTHTIANVLFVPELKTNLFCVGQLQEKGYKISIKDGVCQIQDAKLGLIAQVNMTANRMFPLYLHNTTHSCLSAIEGWGMAMTLPLWASEFWWIKNTTADEHGDWSSSNYSSFSSL